MLNFRPILHNTVRNNRSQTLIAIFSKIAKCQLRHSDSQVTISAGLIETHPHMKYQLVTIYRP